MLEVAKYEYIQLDMPNIVQAWEIGRDRTNHEFGIDPEMREFITQAAIRFPMWRFVGGSSWRRDAGNTFTRVEAYRFHVYEDKEPLGLLSSQRSHAHGRMYCVENERITVERERGSAAKTKDINKALKIMAKKFGSKTLAERVAEAEKSCEGHIYSLRRSKYMDFARGYDHITKVLTHHLMANWKDTYQLAQANGADVKTLDALPTHYENYQVAEEIEKCFDLKNGAVVTIHGNDYAVKEKEGVTIHGTDDLPDWLKRGVGMLKLVDQYTMLGGIGFKINEQSFFVVKGVE